MPIRMLWGHGSFRAHYGSFNVPAHVEVQFFCEDAKNIDDDAIRLLENGDLSNGITDGLLAGAQGVQRELARHVVPAGTVLKSYKLESLYGDIFASNAKNAIRQANVFSPGWNEQDGEAFVHLGGWVQQNAHLGSAADPLVVQFCACRANYEGVEGPELDHALPTPPVAAAPPPPPAGRRRRCYITTAVCDTLGLGDDCHALTALRGFRDAVMLRSEGGRLEVEAYYRTAPGIIARIDAADDPSAIYRDIYARWLVPAVDAVDRGDHVAARRIYRKLVAELEARFPAGPSAP